MACVHFPIVRKHSPLRMILRSLEEVYNGTLAMLCAQWLDLIFQSLHLNSLSLPFSRTNDNLQQQELHLHRLFLSGRSSLYTYSVRAGVVLQTVTGYPLIKFIGEIHCSNLFSCPDPFLHISVETLASTQTYNNNSGSSALASLDPSLTQLANGISEESR